MPVFDPKAALERMGTTIVNTRLFRHARLSEKYDCEIYLKREDEQIVRSYKIRGAYNKISSLNLTEKQKGVVCASAGNHAQGVAYCCKYLGIKGKVFMPVNTPQQKIGRVTKFGGHDIEIFLRGDNYDDCATSAIEYCKQHGLTYIAPFDDQFVIEGQATVGVELLDQLKEIDYVIMPIGGGGLAAGVGRYFNEHSPSTKLIGAEPMGAASMTAAFVNGAPVKLERSILLWMALR